MKDFFQFRESVKSADKKPETYTGPDGKTKTRMVPTDKEVVKETKGAPKGFHFTRDGKLKRGDADQDGPGGRMLRADPLDKQRSKIPSVSEANEDEMPASPDELSMALRQAKFVKYVGEEIEEYLNMNRRFPEWMQNKLSAFHQKAKDMHATMAGEYEDDDEEEMNEKTLTPAEKRKREQIAKAMERENPGMPMDRKMAIATATAKKVAEAVEVSHDRYMRSHGKKASGGEGSWMFTHKRMGDANVNDPKEVHSARGKFSDAKKSAQQWAKKHGHGTVYVMESVQLDEVSDKKLDAYRQKAFADQPSGDDGSDRYRKRKFGRDLAFAKQTGRAKVLATKEEVKLDEAPITGPKGSIHRDASVDQADKEYIMQRQFKDKWKKENPGRQWPGYGNAGFKSKYDFKEEVELDEVSIEKLRDYASAALQDKNKAKANKRWKYAGKAMDKVADREVKAAHARKYNKMESVEQIDEISDEMKARYIRKATSDYTHSNAVRKDAEATGKTDLVAKMKARMKKRNQGVSRAFGGERD